MDNECLTYSELQVEHVGMDKDHCTYCGGDRHLMYAKSLQNYTNGIVKTYIQDGVLRTVYEESDVSWLAERTITHVLSEFHMRYCPICGRDMSQEKYPELKDKWLKVTKDTTFEFSEKDK